MTRAGYNIHQETNLACAGVIQPKILGSNWRDVNLQRCKIEVRLPHQCGAARDYRSSEAGSLRRAISGEVKQFAARIVTFRWNQEVCSGSNQVWFERACGHHGT